MLQLQHLENGNNGLTHLSSSAVAETMQTNKSPQISVVCHNKHFFLTHRPAGQWGSAALGQRLSSSLFHLRIKGSRYQKHDFPTASHRSARGLNKSPSTFRSFGPTCKFMAPTPLPRANINHTFNHTQSMRGWKNILPTGKV